MMDNQTQIRIRGALTAQKLDALVGVLPTHVLLLAGYWPIMANSVAIFTREGERHLVVPADEEKEARAATEVAITTYEPASLKKLVDPVEALGEVVAGQLKALGITSGRVGYELRHDMQPASYLTMNLDRNALANWLGAAMPGLQWVEADTLLKAVRAPKGPEALETLRLGCRIAGQAYNEAVASIVPGATEIEIAGAFTAKHWQACAHTDVRRAEAYFFCMSGPNAGRADAAYARTRHRTLGDGDVAMVHCNSANDGWWTDITRTFVAGDPKPEYTKLRDVLAKAREAALAAVRPGALAKHVDHAARSVMERAGYGDHFTHATGHGVGFAAANPNELPRIHPCSEDVLEEGMTFNIEPAAYFKGEWGMRHCDVVAVTATGADVLTDF